MEAFPIDSEGFHRSASPIFMSALETGQEVLAFFLTPWSTVQRRRAISARES
jgi:hypothetical protein